MNWLKKIDGYKTYAFTVLTAIFVVIEFLIKGDYSLIACWGLAHNASILAIVACVRHAWFIKD